MSGRYVPEHPLDGRLRLLGSDARAEERLEVIWSYFEEVTGERISRPPSQDQRREVLSWLRAQIGTENCPMFFASWPVLHTAAHQTLVEKASNVRKLKCLACDLLVREDGSFPLSIDFALAVEPWTAQSASDRVRIRNRVTAEMEACGMYSPSEHNICMSIVSLVPWKSTGLKDVDNLVKGLLDSFEGLLYHNDRQVQCLTTRRVEYNGGSGAYFISAQAVRPWDVDVIINDGQPPRIY
jgi:Holliday junction resolvase RusA-like endonuclease